MDSMNPRLEGKLRLLAWVVVAGAIAGLAFNVAQGRARPSSLVAGMTYGLLTSIVLGIIELFILEGPLRVRLSSLTFTGNMMVRSVIYAAIIVIIQWLEPGGRIAGLPLEMSSTTFWSSLMFSAVVSILINLARGISDIIGPRALLNFIAGRYHSPVEENRFVLFGDIAGSTGLAERLGGIGIHRFLDRTFRLLTLPVVDYRGEVLDYVGDEIIVTWPERGGAIDCRPLRCFVAMREALAHAASQFEREFGRPPRIRDSQHFC